jgi:hypothetical protein
MVEAHPDRGGTDDAFIEARRAYLLRKEDAVAQRRSHEETEAAEEERRLRDAARFRWLAALAICASAAVLIGVAAAAFYKNRSMTADAGRHGKPAVASIRPAPQFVPPSPFEAAPDSPEATIEGAFASESWPAALVAPSDSARREEGDAAVRSTAPRFPTPEQQAKFIVTAAMDAASAGNIDGTSHCYGDAVNYYSKRMSKSDVIADKRRLWDRWPTRHYTMRPDSLTANCYVIDRARAWMNCEVKGVFDWEATNSNKRSVGSASITYTLTGLGNSDPPDLRIVDENSTVITRTITDISKPRSPQAAAPG